MAPVGRPVRLGAVATDVLVTGSHGLIGSALVASLRGEGRRVVRLVRGADDGPDDRPGDTARWDPIAGTIDRYPTPILPRRVDVRSTRVTHVLGIELDRFRMEWLLKSIGFGIHEVKEANLYYDPEVFTVVVPIGRNEPEAGLQVTVSPPLVVGA